MLHNHELRVYLPIKSKSIPNRDFYTSNIVILNSLSLPHTNYIDSFQIQFEWVCLLLYIYIYIIHTHNRTNHTGYENSRGCGMMAPAGVVRECVIFESDFQKHFIRCSSMPRRQNAHLAPPPPSLTHLHHFL